MIWCPQSTKKKVCVCVCVGGGGGGGGGGEGGAHAPRAPLSFACGKSSL